MSNYISSFNAPKYASSLNLANKRNNLRNSRPPVLSGFNYYRDILDRKTLFDPRVTSVEQLKRINATVFKDLENNFEQQLYNALNNSTKLSSSKIEVKSEEDRLIDDLFKKIKINQEAALDKALERRQSIPIASYNEHKSIF